MCVEFKVPPLKFFFQSHGKLRWNIQCLNLGRLIGHSDCHAVRNETVPITVINRITIKSEI
jgi:hypothetical protein